MLILFAYQTTFANPFIQNYEFTNEYQDIVDSKDSQLLQPNQNVRVLYINDGEELYDYLSKGYLILGSSSFVNHLLSSEKAIEQAKKVKSTLVLIEKTLIDQSITIKDSQDKSDINPLYNYFSVFLVLDESYKKSMLGVNIDDLPNDLIKKYKRNTGAFVFLVYKNTPAYHSNILRNDIITKINGRDVSKDTFSDILIEEKNKSSTLKFNVLRESKSLVIPITLNSF